MDSFLRRLDTVMGQKQFSIFIDLRKKILAAHWLRTCINQSQKGIHLGLLTVLYTAEKFSCGH